jgi:CHAD domain-containing protein
MPRPSPAELFIVQRVNALTRTFGRVREGDVTSVHQARVATRRLREALPLMGASRPARGLTRAARKLTRALGPVRELDVARQMIDGLEAAGDLPQSAASRLRSLLAEERSPLHRELVRRLDRFDSRKLRSKAVALAGRASAAGRRAGHAKRLAKAHERAVTRAARVRAAIESAAAIYLPDRLHEVRIAVKKLRYALEIVKDLSGSRANARILTLKRAQDLLGRMHDLEVLIARTRAAQAAAGGMDLQLSGHLDALVRRLETECRQLHGHYTASRASLLRICDACERPAGARRSPAA